jgi:hypothetical protein
LELAAGEFGGTVAVQAVTKLLQGEWRDWSGVEWSGVECELLSGFWSHLLQILHRLEGVVEAPLELDLI